MESAAIRRTIFDAICFSFLGYTVFFFAWDPSKEELLNLIPSLIALAIGIATGAIISIILNKSHVPTWGEMIFAPNHKKWRQDKPWYKTLWRWQLSLTVGLVFWIGILVTKVSLTDLLDEDGFNGAIRLFAGLASPNFAVFPHAVINIVTTVFMAFIATALSLPFAFVLSFLSAKNIMTGKFSFSIYWIIRLILNVVRSIEALIWATIFSVWVGIGPFAGMMALMIHSVASLAKQYSEMIETVEEGPIEGILSTGANKLQVVWYAILPQVVLPFISFTVYRWDINVRMATIIGLVGGGGIGTMLIQYQGQAMWKEVGTIIIVISFVVWMMDQASTYIREALK